ncbi:MAG: dTDP-4-dehydrorhamnose reductase [Alphaproteobacteria bacterium]|nr:dTDP-4-dehydrorhamnose reductase [Alphaproteobacteria bacterium]MBU0864388.1 dTDP-4-dehydrorhamnose reductase [Alphaproteobacteria bacterium]MBU1825603.1 dTDP-4-dehydrorhamnose reductase [Alphaproteobacteria bacterium]
MKALITGANGQLGRALASHAPASIELIALTSAQLDISDRAAVDAAFIAHAPAIIINAAAYTKVDAAEEMPELVDRVNHLGVAHLAQAAQRSGARMVHISTDFVFDGMASHPYATDAPTAPLNVYGATKLAGERAAGHNSLIIRTSWLYSAYGNNFVATMLRLMRERPELRVVDDQVGTPTSVLSLADALWRLAQTDNSGVMHYSDSGVASWYDFAVAILEDAIAIGLLDQPVDIIPIPSSSYPTPAKRPHYSVLDKRDTIEALGRAPPHWRTNLRDVLEAIKSDG